MNLRKQLKLFSQVETSRKQLRNMVNKNSVNVNSVKKDRRPHQPKHSSQECGCKKCGGKCKPHACSTFGNTCAKCNMKNYFAIRCPMSSKNFHQIKVPDNELAVYSDSVSTDLKINEVTLKNVVQM